MYAIAFNIAHISVGYFEGDRRVGVLCFSENRFAGQCVSSTNIIIICANNNWIHKHTHIHNNRTNSRRSITWSYRVWVEHHPPANPLDVITLRALGSEISWFFSIPILYPPFSQFPIFRYLCHLLYYGTAHRGESHNSLFAKNETEMTVFFCLITLVDRLMIFIRSECKKVVF